MARKTYAEQLKDPRWQRRRLEVLEAADFKCTNCGADKKTLHVHHKIYRRGAQVWEYSDSDLEALCEDCHAEETLSRRQLDEAIAQLSVGDVVEIAGYAEGMVADGEAFDGRHDCDVRKWSFRTFEHAFGFAARIFHPRPDVITKMLSLQPFSSDELHWLIRYGFDDGFAAIERTR